MELTKLCLSVQPEFARAVHEVECNRGDQQVFRPIVQIWACCLRPDHMMPPLPRLLITNLLSFTAECDPGCAFAVRRAIHRRVPEPHGDFFKKRFSKTQLYDYMFAAGFLALQMRSTGGGRQVLAPRFGRYRDGRLNGGCRSF